MRVRSKVGKIIITIRALRSQEWPRSDSAMSSKRHQGALSIIPALFSAILPKIETWV